MLEQLFGSRTRIKLLKVFFQEPGKSFYIRELTRKLGERINSIRREIANLGRLGVLEDAPAPAGKLRSRKEKSDQNKRKYYRIDFSFALYTELKNLILKSQLAIKKDLVDLIQKQGTVRVLLLTGFFLGEESPTDILIVGSIQRQNVKRLIAKFEKMIGQELNYTFFSPQEFRLRHAMTDRFLYAILDGKKIVVVNKMKGLNLE